MNCVGSWCASLLEDDDDDSYGFGASLRSLLHLGFSRCIYVLFLHMFQSLPSYPPTMHSYVCLCVCVCSYSEFQGIYYHLPVKAFSHCFFFLFYFCWSSSFGRINNVINPRNVSFGLNWFFIIWSTVWVALLLWSVKTIAAGSCLFWLLCLSQTRPAVNLSSFAVFGGEPTWQRTVRALDWGPTCKAQTPQRWTGNPFRCFH